MVRPGPQKGLERVVGGARVGTRGPERALPLNAMPGAGVRLARAPDAAGLEQVQRQLARASEQVEEVEPLDRVLAPKELGGAAGRAPKPGRQPRIGDLQERERLLSLVGEQPGHLAREHAARAEASEDVRTARPDAADRLDLTPGEVGESRRRLADADLLAAKSEEGTPGERRRELVAERSLEAGVVEEDGLGAVLRAEPDHAFHGRIITDRGRASPSTPCHAPVKAR